MANKKKIIRIGHIVGKMNGGGVENMLLNYYRYIDKEKYQFDFIIDSDSTIVPRKEIEDLGGRIFEIPPYQKLFSYNKVLFKLINKQKYNIIHSHINSLSVFPLRIAARANIPVRIAHSHSTAAPGEYTKNILKNILRPFSEIYPTDYLACSEHAAKWLFKNNAKETNILPNGIEIDKFCFRHDQRQLIRKELNISDKFVIGHTGRLSFQKNQEFLIKLMPIILEKNKSAVLLLFGEGSLRQNLEKLARKLGVYKNVIFLGNRSDVFRFYNAMDVFVFPSKYEGLGISAIEAQVNGLKVILSNKVPFDAKISDNCYFFDLNNKSEWIDKIISCESQVRDSSSNFDNTYNIKENVRELESFYEDKLKTN